jgi:hypothetical protein
MKPVFISYSSDGLQEKGLKVWIDKTRLKSGARNWEHERRKGKAFRTPESRYSPPWPGKRNCRLPLPDFTALRQLRTPRRSNTPGGTVI